MDGISSGRMTSSRFGEGYSAAVGHEPSMAALNKLPHSRRLRNAVNLCRDLWEPSQIARSAQMPADKSVSLHDVSSADY